MNGETMSQSVSCVADLAHSVENSLNKKRCEICHTDVELVRIDTVGQNTYPVYGTLVEHHWVCLTCREEMNVGDKKHKVASL